MVLSLLRGSWRMVDCGPGPIRAGGKVSLEEPDGHFKMAQATALVASSGVTALDGRAAFHIFQVK